MGSETPRAPPGSTSSGSKQTRHNGGSRRSCQSAALSVTGVAPPPPPPPPPPQSPALPGPVCLGPVVRRRRPQRRQRWPREEALTAPAHSRPRPAPPLALRLTRATPRPSRCFWHPNRRGQGGAGQPAVRSSDLSPLHTHPFHTCRLKTCVGVCLREGDHIFCLALANSSEPGVILVPDWDVWVSSGTPGVASRSTTTPSFLGARGCLSVTQGIQSYSPFSEPETLASSGFPSNSNKSRNWKDHP